MLDRGFCCRTIQFLSPLLSWGPAVNPAVDELGQTTVEIWRAIFRTWPWVADGAMGDLSLERPTGSPVGMLGFSHNTLRKKGNYFHLGAEKVS